MKAQKGKSMNVEKVTLGSYADHEQTTLENVTRFLQDVERASLPDIVGATSGAWAVCHGSVQQLIAVGRVVVDENMHPWEYVWKVG